MDDKSNTAEPRKPRHCRFQLRLRALLVGVAVLALPCAWLGSQVKIVHDRTGTIARVRAAGGDAMTTNDFWILDVEQAAAPSGSVALGHPKPISGIRRWLGDDDFSVIGIPDGFSRYDEQMIRDGFPVAVVGKISTRDGTIRGIVGGPLIYDLDFPDGKLIPR